MTKVGFFDGKVRRFFFQIAGGIGATVSLIAIFFDIPPACKLHAAVALLIVFAVLYISIWIWANKLSRIKIDVEGSTVEIKAGDLFQQEGLKVIAFNEYFDTQVDDVIISKRTLNGVFINKHLNVPVGDLDNHIESYDFAEGEYIGENKRRSPGKRKKYRLGTICMYEEFLLAAFSKFDDSNRASLTMPEYLEFLINFWDRVNSLYALRSVSTPILGSGITRIKGHKSISDEDLLKILLWTFRISEMRFKHPARLTIVVHKDKIDQINLLDIRSVKNGV